MPALVSSPIRNDTGEPIRWSSGNSIGIDHGFPGADVEQS